MQTHSQDHGYTIRKKGAQPHTTHTVPNTQKHKHNTLAKTSHTHSEIKYYLPCRAPDAMLCFDCPEGSLLSLRSPCFGPFGESLPVTPSSCKPFRKPPTEGPKWASDSIEPGCSGEHCGTQPDRSVAEAKAGRKKKSRVLFS